MTQEEIKAIFDKVFKGFANPIFCYPISYFEKDNFLYEIAAAKTYDDTNLARTHFHYVEPLMIFELLFCDEGYYMTVLEKTADNYVHRTDLGRYIKDNNELRNFMREINYDKD